MTDYSASLDFYKQAKKYAESNEPDYRAALIYLRLALEAVLKTQFEENFTDLHSFINLKLTEKDDISGNCHTVRKSCNNAVHFNYPNDRSIEEFKKEFSKANTSLSMFFKSSNIILEDISSEEIKLKFENLKRDFYLQCENMDNPIFWNEIKDSVYEKLHILNGKNKIKLKSIRKPWTKHYGVFFSSNLSGCNVELEMVVRVRKFNLNKSNNIEFGSINYGIMINFIIKNDDINIREFARKTILNSLEKKSIVENISTNEYEWELYKKAESLNAKGRSKICLFLPLEIDFDKKKFKYQDIALDRVSKSYFELIKLLNELKK